jgi:hypothetical protein
MSSNDLIMEGWRDWLSGLLGKKEPRRSERFNPDFKEHIALSGGMYGKYLSIAVYIPSKFSEEGPVIDEDNKPIVVSMMMLSKISKGLTPCIPNTWQVSYSATDPDFQKLGMGTFIYELAATYVKIAFDGGITSDHEDSTSSSAARRWDKIETNPNFEKRKTAAGSDTFDYEGDTSDPNDDCMSPRKKFNVVDHSYEIVNDLKSEMKKLQRKHSDYKKISNMDNLEDFIYKEAIRVFKDAY